MAETKLPDNLEQFSETVSEEVRAIRTMLNGNKLTLALLRTTSRENLVEAINEVFTQAQHPVSFESIEIAVNDYFVLHPQTFVYPQGTAVTSMLITHPLDHSPGARCLDSAGTEWIGQVTHPAPNQVLVQFNIPFAGTVTLY
jgi:hypothetical protein